MRVNYIGSVSVIAVILLSGCGINQKSFATCAAAGDACTRFTILHTNDNHGRFWENKHGEYGMAARKTLIDSIRQEVNAQGEHVLLFSGGDINTGVPESDLLYAEPDFKGMNHIGYDVMAVGNHEFDNPLAVLDKQRQWAEFPMLAANIYKSVEINGVTKQVRYFEPYKIFEFNGLKLAVIGMTTEDTVRIGNPEYVSELAFTEPQQEIKNVIAEIEQLHSVDIIFAVTHMGHYANGLHGSNAPGDVLMAKSLKVGQLQAIFGGHSQNPVCMESNSHNTNNYADFAPGDKCIPDQQNDTWIMQAHEWGKYVGRADFEFFNGKLNLAKFELIPVNLKVKNSNGERILVGDAIIPDQELKEFLLPFQLRGQDKLDEVIGVTKGKLIGDRDLVRSQQTNLGRLIAMAQSNGAVKADFGVMNSGGVRASIETGEITYRDVLSVQPFGNMITLNTMTGAEVKAYLASVATMTRGSGGYAQFSGIEMVVNCTEKAVEISKIGGRDFNISDSYSFTVPSYNAAGGNDYPKLTEAINTGFVDADILYQFFKKQPQINAADFDSRKEITYMRSSSPFGCDPAS
ncbi:bifunctional UDP-sugar hydrolase/5'-nucleotidase UshA [Shewanella halifaxensis]|nr:bifunctional UDP-sugar hydrolase/5'-nucleotidase UshA [Shewanella halifaxensis]